MPTVIYGIDGANNKVETLTKEQILDAIAQAQQGGSVLDYDDAFISKIKEINHNNQMQFWIGTQAEYNAIQTPENNVLYIISDDTSKEDILAAIDNLAESVAGFRTALNAKQNVLTFDTTPTQNSENPVTSGGIYAALHSAVTKTVLWERPYDAQEQEYDSSVMTTVGDEVTLAQSVENFDYIEIHLYYDDFMSEIKLYEAINNKKIIVRWFTTYIYSTEAHPWGGVNSNEMYISFNNNKATVTRAQMIGYSTQSGSAGSYNPDSVYASIYRIVGVKIP